MSPINYLANSYFQSQLKTAPYYRKKTMSLLRQPLPEELGKLMTTYVKCTASSGYRIESQTLIDKNYIMARNDEILGYCSKGRPIFNDYPIPIDTLIKNYGNILEFLTLEYRQFQKIAVIKCVELDAVMLQSLTHQTQDPQIFLSIPGQTLVMKAVLGDYLSGLGYSISSHNMKNYEKI